MAEYQRRLPHFQPDGEHQFVTWRLAGSLPAAQPSVLYATPGHAFAAKDRLLARGSGPVWLSDTRVAQRVAEAILTGDFDKGLYDLQAWVVMPNHVHLLTLPKSPLAKITHWLKGKTARDANLLLGLSGQPFWQHESYDHWVRHEAQFNRIARYIEENPVAAGLLTAPEDWRWSSASWVR